MSETQAITLCLFFFVVVMGWIIYLFNAKFEYLHHDIDCDCEECAWNTWP